MTDAIGRTTAANSCWHTLFQITRRRQCFFAVQAQSTCMRYRSHAALHTVSRSSWNSGRGEKSPPVRPGGDRNDQALLLSAISRARIGFSTNSASATTTKFISVVTTNTMCQPPVEALMMLATGIRKADAPLAV